MDELIQNLLRLQTLEFGEARADNAAVLITELRGKIPAQMLGHYDRLRARGKKGLAAVTNQVCAGCHMRLPLGVIMTLKRGQDMQVCDNCGRYLYLCLPDAVQSPPPANRPRSKPVRSDRRKKKTVAAPDSVTMDPSLPLAVESQPRLSPE
jgi:hypothetical protein